MKKGFTLVELMVSVSILSIGIVAVLRSFISMTYALDVSANRLEAARFLEARMDELEEKLISEEDYELEVEEKEVPLRSRVAQYKLEVTEVVLEQEQEEGKEESEEGSKKQSMNEAKMLLSWKEEQKTKDATLATYFEKKK